MICDFLARDIARLRSWKIQDENMSHEEKTSQKVADKGNWEIMPREPEE